MMAEPARSHSTSLSRHGLSQSSWNSVYRGSPRAISRFQDNPTRILPPDTVEQLDKILHKADVSSFFLPRLIDLIESLYGVSHIGSIADFDPSEIEHTHNSFEIGDIVIIPYVVPCVDRHANLADNQFIFSSKTGPVLAKKRPSIVVAKYMTSMTCLPMFTSHGRGFRECYQTECLWVRNPEHHGISEASQTVSKSLTCYRRRTVAERSYIDLTRPYTILYNYPLQIIGRLETLSTIYLKAQWQAANERGHQPIHERPERIENAGFAATARRLLTFGRTSSHVSNRSRKRSHPSSMSQNSPRAPKRRRNDYSNHDNRGYSRNDDETQIDGSSRQVSAGREIWRSMNRAFEMTGPQRESDACLSYAFE